MKWIIAILLLTLLSGYVVNHYVLADNDARWYCYFVVNDAKAFLIALALGVVTWGTKNFVYAMSAIIITAFDLLAQVLDINVKGNWAELCYQILIGLLIVNIAWQLRKK